MAHGDRVIAIQTGSSKRLVGLATYVGDVGTGAARRVKLRPDEWLGVTVRVLKKQDPRGIGRIDALQGGNIQTIYDITTRDAHRLIAAARRMRDTAAAKVAHKASASARGTGAGFGNAEENRKVERAAVRAVTRKLTARGWHVKSVEAAKVGYDLKCWTATCELHVEVKGIKGTKPTFFITQAEGAYWKGHTHARIAVVTSALTKPKIRFLDPATDSVAFAPVLYRGSSK
ncbi:MAG: DUF3883 domain-containing protein [Myxococcales bacterium]|nr:DUF3883 domain-containing protein [Myxococcales bacterium]